MSLKFLGRSQWLDIEGSPKTSILAFDTPIGKTENMGLGLSVFNDQIGPVDETNFSIDRDLYPVAMIILLIPLFRRNFIW